MTSLIIELPDIGEGITEAELSEWSVSVGDIITEDQTLAVVMTDKAAVEIPSPTEGKVTTIFHEVGEIVAVGSTLIEIQVADGTSVEVPSQANQDTVIETGVNKNTETQAKGDTATHIKATQVQHLGNTASNSGIVNDKPLTSPVVRRLARDHNVDLRTIIGSGKNGRILKEDFLQAISGNTVKEQLNTSSQTTLSEDQITVTKMIGMRRKIAEKMQQSKHNIPHFTYGEEIDMTELEKMRAHLNSHREEEQTKLNLLPFLTKAILKALQKYPQMNCRYDEDAGEINTYANVHLGIAAQTNMGLAVPVVHNVQQYNLWECASAISNLTSRAKMGKVTAKEMSGSTITITSLGAIGGIFSTPIINHPEVAIIGVNKLFDKLVLDEGNITTRRCMNISASFDHRIVDGMEAAEFIQVIKKFLENPSLVII
ncbi:MAG: 2-oxoisovalerate dehydrogenase E2 component (dihydrolipoyl transacylase) [Candidatus Endobugula sp.]|jgi:2-oxoisovalerate dehydrogenase E2 component (dihydrolipoyl transacylase)